jgi:hypothetical protein
MKPTSLDSLLSRMGISIPLEGRLGMPWEQAYYALFLVSDDSAYGG